MIQLTYNSQTKVGAGCTERTDAGISWYGKHCIEKMNELGIIVDTGHCGRQTTIDACTLSSKPVVASHTAVAAICPHDRGKSDQEFKAVAKTGGVIGLAMVPFFLNVSGRADMNDFLNHVDYLRALVGVPHIGIGTDWPLAVPARIMRENFIALTASLGFREEHNIKPMATVTGFDTYFDFPNIARGLVARGYRDDDIIAILGGNFLRVFEEVCG
jgi:membrane dipeptidase